MTAPSVRFPRELREGMTGADVIAHKRALSRARPDLYQWTAFTDYAGDFFLDGIVKWKASKGLGTTRVLGGRAHEALERTHRKGSTTQWAFDATAISLAEEYWQKVTKTPEERTRRAIVAAGRSSGTSAGIRSPIRSTAVPASGGRRGCPPAGTARPSVRTSATRAGGSGPERGAAYESRLGYTGTLIEHGTPISRDKLTGRPGLSTAAHRAGQASRSDHPPMSPSMPETGPSTAKAATRWATTPSATAASTVVAHISNERITMKFGTAVVYEGDAEQKHLAFITSHGENKTNADLLVVTGNGNAEYEDGASPR